MSHPQKRLPSDQAATLSVSEVYTHYRTYVIAFQAAGGPQRELLSAEKFAEFWLGLNDTEQTEYLGKFNQSYKSASSAAVNRGAAYVSERVLPSKKPA